ncbi:winged helix domain-containing protein [Shigella flexneri]
MCWCAWVVCAYCALATTCMPMVRDRFPHRPALDALASNIALTAENFGDALEDPSFLAMLAALVNSGYWFFEG